MLNDKKIENKELKNKELKNKQIENRQIENRHDFKLNEERLSENEIEVVKKFVRFEETTWEYLKLFYKRYKKIINLVVLVLIVVLVYVILMISAKSNTQHKDIEDIEDIEVNEVTQAEKHVQSNENNTEANTPDTFKSKEKISGKVYITGEIINPGVYDIKEGDRIENVIAYAGGITTNANIEIVNLSEIVADEQHIVIPNVNDNLDSIEAKSNTSKSGEETKVNINKAGLEELKSISGVGDTIATNIIQYREENGNFKSIEEIKNVTGVGEKSYEKMKNQIRVK